MTKKEYFYEVLTSWNDGIERKVTLVGPVKDIYRAKGKNKTSKKYKFVQVIGGQVIGAYTDKQIVVLDRKI